MIVKDAIKRLEGMDEEEIICFDIWVKEDVLAQADNLGLLYNEEMAQDILTIMEDNFDANIGHSWDTMNVYLWEER